MRDVQVCLHIAPSFGIGGAQVRFAQLANHFGGRQHHVILALDGNFDSCALLSGSVTTDRLTEKADRLSGLARLPGMRAVMRAYRPDLLVTYNWGSIEWAFANRFASIVARHLHFEDGFGPEERDRQLPRRVWFRRLALSGRHSRLIVPSKTLLGIATALWKIDSSRISYVPNGIDLARFAPDPGSAADAGRGRVALVGTVARLRPEKNLHRLVEALAIAMKRSPCRLEIAGDGAERDALTATVARLAMGDHVRLVGNEPRPERFLRRLDIFAISSDTEQMPISLVEAMASGLPVASTDVGDIVNMLSPENAALVRGCRDAAGLAEQIARLAADPALRRRLGDANLATARRSFDEREMLATYETLFGAR